MLTKTIFAIIIVIAVIAGFSGYLEAWRDNKSNSEVKAEHTAPVEGFERGPHRGRMLREDDFAVEITIFEDGVPPEFHVYVYEDNKPLPPQNVKLTIDLSRHDKELNQIGFTPVDDYLKGNAVIVEPHSFDVSVEAAFNGKTYKWNYQSYEGRTQISADAAKASGIETDKAGPAVIQDNVTLSGQIVLNGNTTANVRARFPGIVRSVKKGLGETVEEGDVLATVESNDSLQVYSVKAPIKGMILTRNTNIGDVAGDTPLFTIADLSDLWAEFHVFPRDIGRVQMGQDVVVSSLDGVQTTSGKIESLLPVAESATQTTIVRVPLDNANGLWRAGMTVQGKLTIAEREVPLAVKISGLQRFRDFTVVFALVDDVYEVRMLELGQDDGNYVEVLKGIKPDTTYVSGNSFLIRADIEKSGASHDH